MDKRMIWGAAAVAAVLILVVAVVLAGRGNERAAPVSLPGEVTEYVVEMTVDERIVTGTYAMYVAGELYDIHCENGAHMAENPEDRGAINMQKNAELLVARVGAQWRKHHPQATADQRADALAAMKEDLAGPLRETLKEKGCESEEAAEMRMLREMFIRNRAEATNAMIDQKIAEENRAAE